MLILGKSPIKWRQRSDMIIAIDWDAKHGFKQTNLALHRVVKIYEVPCIAIFPVRVGWDCINSVLHVYDGV